MTNDTSIKSPYFTGNLIGAHFFKSGQYNYDVDRVIMMPDSVKWAAIFEEKHPSYNARHFMELGAAKLLLGHAMNTKPPIFINIYFFYDENQNLMNDPIDKSKLSEQYEKAIIKNHLVIPYDQQAKNCLNT